MGPEEIAVLAEAYERAA